MKKYIKILQIIIIISAISLIFTMDNKVFAQENIKKIQVTEVNIEEKNDHIQINLNIPHINGIKQNQKEINKQLKDRAQDFSNGIKKMSDENYKESKKQGQKVIVYEASTNFNIEYVGENYMSMLVDYYSYTGGAHGSTLREAYNIDINTGKILSLKDIFKENYNYKEVINNLIKKYVDKDKDNYLIDDFKGIKENQEFYISQDGIVIYFQLYEIAPYSTGFPEFKIPLKNVEDGLNINLK